MKKSVSILLIVILLCGMVFSACSLKEKEKEKEEETPSGSNGIDINAEDFDTTTPILSIGDQSVSFAVYKALYDSYLPYMQSMGYDPLESKSSLESFQDWLADSLAKDLVTLHQAEENGFTLTPEQEEELSQKNESEISELYDLYRGYAEDDHEEDPTVTVDAYFANYIEKISEYYIGVKMNWEEYKEAYRAEGRRSYIIEKYREEVCREFNPTRKDVLDWYETQFNSNKESYEGYPAKYKIDEEYYEMYYGIKEDAYPILYVPSGYSRMMHIIVTPEGQLSEEYEQKIARMDEIKSEYAELAFADALSGGSDNAEAIAALIEEYRGLKAETEEEYASFTAAAMDKIGQAYAALEAGQPFAEVMMEYTEDTDVIGDEDYEGCEAFREKGQLISLKHDSVRDWSKGVKEEFKKLKPGEYSEVFMDNGSCHIIYYVGDEPEGTVDINDVYSIVEAVCMTGVNNTQWDALVSEWLNDPKLVKNEELIRALGASEVGE